MPGIIVGFAAMHKHDTIASFINVSFEAVSRKFVAMQEVLCELLNT